ncbi:MAG TPA: hypothetical protein VFC86_08380 [Planctomycetota bacterium]|nr:hypothetical protein [Planctomycetota bacterium]
MRTVYSTLDVAHSLIVRIALKDAGIKFFMPNENAASWNTDLGSPAVPLEFQVAEGDFAAAEKVIREALDRIRKKKTRSTK